MAVCASAVQTANGLSLVLDPTVTDVTACAYVVQTGNDAALGSLLALTPSDATVITAAVLQLWLVAWGIRQVILMLRGSENVQDES